MGNEELIAAHITRNPEIFKGKPIIRNTRIAVDLVVDWVQSGIPVEVILDDYPVLSGEDIEAAMAFDEQQRSAS